MRYFRLPPRSRWELRSSGLLHSRIQKCFEVVVNKQLQTNLKSKKYLARHNKAQWQQIIIYQNIWCYQQTFQYVLPAMYNSYPRYKPRTDFCNSNKCTYYHTSASILRHMLLTLIHRLIPSADSELRGNVKLQRHMRLRRVYVIEHFGVITPI